jgi:hypothetical protein
LLPVGFQTGSLEQQLALFNPEPTIPGVQQFPSSASDAPPLDQKVITTQAPAPDAPSPSDRLLSDGQIGTMHKRLQLRPSQQKFWPKVEVALKDIVWAKPESKGQMRIIDPNSRGILNLRPAAAPLMASLNEEQKLEIRRLAGLVGLQELIVED